MAEMRREKATVAVQMAFRSFAARKELRRRRVAKDQAGAVTRINALARGIRDRKRAARLRERKRRNEAAAKAQV